MPSIINSVPEGFRPSRTAKGWIKPTASTLQAQRTAAENRVLKAQMQALKEQFEVMLNPTNQEPGEPE
jgi:hypothetical protein